MNALTVVTENINNNAGEEVTKILRLVGKVIMIGNGLAVCIASSTIGGLYAFIMSFIALAIIYKVDKKAYYIVVIPLSWIASIYLFGKLIIMLWSSPIFWILAIGYIIVSLITGKLHTMK